MIEYSAGIVTAYGSAVRAGYTGTYEDFCRQQAQYAENAQAVEQAKNTAVSAKDDAVTAKNTAVSAKDDAVSAKNTAVSAKDDAVSAKNTASTKAQEASVSATSAGLSATSAGQSATDAERSAQSVSASVQQIATNTTDIGKLKADLDYSEGKTLSYLFNTKRINTTSGQSIPSSNSIFNVTIPANTPFIFRINDSDSTIGTFGIYGNGSAYQYNCVANTDYSFTKSNDITSLSIYCSSVSKTGSVQAVLTVKNTEPNIENTLELQESKISAPQPSNLINPDALIQNAYINNSGNESYSSDFCCTDYIRVYGGITYYLGDCVNNYNAFYDDSKNFVRRNVITGLFNRNGEFTPPYDGYIRVTITSQTFIQSAYINPYFNSFREYNGKSYYSEYPTESRAVGDYSSNLFKGGSNYGDFSTTTGELTYKKDRLITPLIEVSEYLCWFIDSNVNGYAQYLLEYDTSKTFTGYKTLSGDRIGIIKLEPATRYVRINSSGSISGMVTPAAFDKMLYLTKTLEELIKFIPAGEITTPATVSESFFRKSVVFCHDYVRSAIESYSNNINMNGYDFVIPCITDIHSINSEPYNMLSYMAESGVADVCFNLGDNMAGLYPDDATYAIGFHKAVNSWSRPPYALCPLYVLRGNHDNNPVTGNDSDKMISDREYFNLYDSRTKIGYAGTNLNYGYRDFDQAKIRVIWLDSGDIYDANGEPITSGLNVSVGQNQVNWFISALDFSDKANKSEWSVITISHAELKQLAETLFNNIMYAFLHGSSTSGTFTQTFPDTGSTRVITYSADFTAQGAMEYICHLNGHLHYDNAFLMGNTGRYDIDINCDCADGGVIVDGNKQNYTYTEGTINERCMDTFCLDKANRKIYMKRLGVGSDRTFDY